MQTIKSGFTLIELVVVIVIIGVLAATAAPRFINLSDNANNAVGSGVFSSFASAVNIYQATCIVRGGDTTDPADTFNIDGVRSSNSGSCYPVRADSGSNRRRINAPRSCLWILENIVESEYLDDLPSYQNSNNPNNGTRTSETVSSQDIQDARNNVNDYPFFIHQRSAWFSYCHFYSIEGDLTAAPFLLLNAMDGQVVTGTADISAGFTWSDELAKYSGDITEF